MIIYGIPNCSTVKDARAWLTEHQVEFEFHDYRKDGLSLELLESLEQRVGWEKMLNKRSLGWKALTPEQKAAISRDTAIETMLATPSSIKRPLLDTGDKIILGFKAEHYQTEL